MTTKIPIVSVAFLRRWQRQHRRLVGSTPRDRHLYLARTLALTGMTPAQTAIVTAHQARVDATYCCDCVAEHVAAELRPPLFATVMLNALAEGKPMIIGDSPSRDDIVEAEAALNALAEGKTTTTSRKRKP